ncbi:MAG: hypothetical protein M1834_004358 [Cirrosporium novae-zelandiae]|nr:MAG: hypothetical protein M1834_004358 [Cirrosporium novae-zelandiae]
MEGTRLTLPGSVAYSDFRRRNLANRIGATDVEGQYLHYVDLLREFNDKDRATLSNLLDYGERSPGLTGEVEGVENGQVRTFYVTPRTGTISPWSSQATGIAHVVGFHNQVKRIERGRIVRVTNPPSNMDDPKVLDMLHDRMTETITATPPDLSLVFSKGEPGRAVTMGTSKESILEANKTLGLALDESEIEYLVDACRVLERGLTDVELFMFSQINSEHCRHKHFGAQWVIDGENKPHTLFEMIKMTSKKSPKHLVSAYSDNAAVMEGHIATSFQPDWSTGAYASLKENIHFLAKVESHNHPTAISPFPGAATGSGGEIRDEGAVGRGSHPRSGIVGFSTSDLLIPDFKQPWELDVGKPDHIASSLDIMLEAPLGSSSFSNEFGRPSLTGFFRTLTTEVPIDDSKTEIRGYHKPIMIAGGVGIVRDAFAKKNPDIVNPGALLIAIGGPAMLIGLGGGAASSVASGEGSAQLDFASVQRGNAEVQRRCQEVINTCTNMGPGNPILFIHDVGAGGLSNAFPELAKDVGLGAKFELREVDNADTSMSPLQIWCCEAQERYVLAINEIDLTKFKLIANRERCGFRVVGTAIEKKELVLTDRNSQDCSKPIDLPMDILFGKTPKLTKVVETRKLRLPSFDSSLSTYRPKAPINGAFDEALTRVLRLPSVGSKKFLITIGDRTVGGLTARDQMVGPWQVPVADCSVTAESLDAGSKDGLAMSVGEKPLLALINPGAAARMTVAESLMNIAASNVVDQLERIVLSANWMAAVQHEGEGSILYQAVYAVSEICKELGIAVPTGKDSLSMKMRWKSGEEAKEVTSPLSLVVSAFAPVADIRKTWTPQLQRVEDVGESILVLVDLAQAKRTMGASALAQVFGQVGDDCPDVRDVDMLRDFFDAQAQMMESDVVLAYHDISDGGLIVAVIEMMIAGRVSVDLSLDALIIGNDIRQILEALFSEELGAVFQISKKRYTEFIACFSTCGPPRGLLKKIGTVTAKPDQTLSIYNGIDLIYRETRVNLEKEWSQTSYHMQKLRDNPACAEQEFENISDSSNPGLSYKLTYDPKETTLPLLTSLKSLLVDQPRVAILREQGSNGAAEMAWAFNQANFSPVDVCMSDLITGRVSLGAFRGIAAVGGFSYGDVLGAGRGWAQSVTLHEIVRKEFQDFFERPDTFSLGVCNGAQFLTQLKSLIPGAENWPTFERNTSEQFEARVSMVEVIDNSSKPSVFLDGMNGSKIPIAVSHGEGRAQFTTSSPEAVLKDNLVSFRYVDNHLKPTEKYPYNPNGSPHGITGVRSQDGRVLAMMPHPERTILAGVGSYIPRGKAETWGKYGPWYKMFMSVRKWCG